eukprot:45682-Rhodomonas_salina.2
MTPVLFHASPTPSPARTWRVQPAHDGLLFSLGALTAYGSSTPTPMRGLAVLTRRMRAGQTRRAAAAYAGVQQRSHAVQTPGRAISQLRRTISQLRGAARGWSATCAPPPLQPQAQGLSACRHSVRRAGGGLGWALPRTCVRGLR